MKKEKQPPVFWFWCILSEIAVKKAANRSGSARGEVWENLIIIQATDEKEAYRKAMSHGKKLNGDSSGTLRLDGKPAEKLFLGVQDMGLVAEEIGDGCEILFWSRRQTLEKAKSRIRGEKVLPRLAEVVRRNIRVMQMEGVPKPPKRANRKLKK